MIRYISLVLLFVVLSLSSHSANRRIDSLLVQLDRAVEKRAYYTELKNERIADLRRQMQNATSLTDKIRYANTLCHEFNSFKTDSALFYTVKMGELASRAGDKAMCQQAEINQAGVLRMMGLLKESSDRLDELEGKVVQEQSMGYVYARLSTLNALRDFALDDQGKQAYERQAKIYRDSLLNHFDLQLPNKLFVLAEKALKEGNTAEILSQLEEAYRQCDPLIRSAGILAHNIASFYKRQGDSDMALEYYIRSAIADLTSGIKSYLSLRLIAATLYEQGDIDRAYTYMKCSMEDAIFCNARLRTLEVSDMFMLIEKSYQTKEESRSRQLGVFLIATILLTVMLLLALIYVYRQKYKLSAVKNIISESNRTLQVINSNLTEANRIKEEYITQYMEQYAGYLSRINSCKMKVKKMAKDGNFDSIEQLFSTEDDMKEFYGNFDKTVLRLFPDFIVKFNDLLKPDQRITLKNENELTPELRIFALIRLGITDSVQIAHFLSYSVSTIYNYRTKIRNKALGDRDDFENQVMRIGTAKG